MSTYPGQGSHRWKTDDAYRQHISHLANAIWKVGRNTTWDQHDVALLSMDMIVEYRAHLVSERMQSCMGEGMFANACEIADRAEMRLGLYQAQTGTHS